MRLAGLERMTLSDFPGRVACTVFTAGCNLQCPYCHNPSLIDGDSRIDQRELFTFLDDRKDLLDGVVISGGEPTLQADLPAFADRIAGRGLDVKLDTNGTRPSALDEALRTDAIDYVAMDLKTSPDRYDELGASGGSAVAQSVRILQESDVDHEFRTTYDPGVVSPTDFETIFDLVGEGPLFVQSVETEDVLDPGRVAETPPEPIRTIQEAVGSVPSQIECRE